MKQEKLKQMLLLTDAKATNELFTQMFEDDFNIFATPYVKEAAQLLKNTDADISVVILDVTDSPNDAFGVLEMMRSDEYLSAIPVIVAIPSEDVKAMTRALELGAVDILTKPFSIDASIIRQRINNFLSLKRANLLSEQNRIYALIASKADKDELTGLLNQSGFYRKAHETLVSEPDKKFILVRWDLNRFKVFNELYGMKAGDELLKAIGEYESKISTDELCCARLENDHFVYIKPKSDMDIEGKIHKMKEWFREYPMHFDFSPCIGIYEIEDPSVDVAIMCDRALLAMQTVKGQHERQLAFYDDALRRKMLFEQRIIDEMAPRLPQVSLLCIYSRRLTILREMSSAPNPSCVGYTPKEGLFFLLHLYPYSRKTVL